MADLAVFLVLVAVVAVAGIRVGMLVAPRLGRLADPDDEDQGGDAD
ncbi:MAG TPA: hypothetical protein VF494_08200 [Candidatus Limnocylindrales bacterium]